ncbi:MAG: glycosyltransferase family 39 protein [Lentisphaerae bacterium]|nr:glycosyltransferase family 39 protein [Lentisphaerota bacterium]
MPMKKTPPVAGKTLPLNRRRFCWLLLGAAAAALLWRLVVAWQIADGKFSASMFLPAETTDLRTYMELSKSVASGQFEGPFYYQPFYYSVFLVLCRWIFGASVWGVVITQAVLGAGTAYLSGLTAGKIAGKLAGIVAAYLTALCTVLVFYTPFHQIATLQAFNLALLSFTAVQAFRSGKYRWTAAMAAAGAVGALTRGNVLLLVVPLLAALSIVQCRRCSWRKALLTLLLGAGMFLAVESPFIIYNSIQLGRLAGPSTAADAVLALGNTPEAPPGGRDPGLPAGPMEYPQAYHIWMQDVERNPVWKKILNYLVEEPAAYLELTFRKLLLFWDSREIPNNVALAGEGSTAGFLKVTVPPGILLALGIAGMLLSCKRLRKSQYLALFIIIVFYWGATAAFYNLSRFRAPILPELAIFSGVFVMLMRLRSQQGDWKYIRIYGFLSLALGCFLTLGAYEFYRTMLEKTVIKTVRPQGTVLTLPDERHVQFYHGPMTFGAWQILECKSGTTLEVDFPNPLTEQMQQAEVEFSLQSSRPGVMVLDVAGAPVTVSFKAVEFKKITVRLPENFRSNNVRVKVLHNSAEAGFIADFQRDYGASSLNERSLPAEIVMRITR